MLAPKTCVSSYLENVFPLYNDKYLTLAGVISITVHYIRHTASANCECKPLIAFSPAGQTLVYFEPKHLEFQRT